MAPSKPTLPLEFIKYLLEIEKSLDTPEETTVHTIIQNVFEEIKGKEVDMAMHFDCSRVLESIIRKGSQTHVLCLLNTLGTSVRTLAIHPFSSHVLETLFSRIEHLDMDIQLVRAVQKITREMERNMMLNHSSTHVFRTVLHVLDKHEPVFKTNINSLVECILASISNISEAICDQSISPLLQIILELDTIDGHRQQILNQVCTKLTTSQWIVDISRSKVGSRFLEMFFRHVDIDSTMYSKMLHGKESILLMDRNANFVLQSIVRQISDPSLIHTLILSISPEFPNVIPRNRFGTIVEIVRSLERCMDRNLERAVRKMLMAILGITKENRLRIIPMLASLNRDSYELQGCLAASVLVTRPAGKYLYVKSLIKQPFHDIFRMATDPKASHILSAFLNTSQKDMLPYKFRLANRFLAHPKLLTQLNTNKYGTYIVEQIADCLDTKSRTELAGIVKPRSRIEWQ